MRVLGIDPGLNKIGWAIVENGKAGSANYITSGFLSTNSTEQITQRLAYIFRNISEIIETYKPELVAIEEVFVNLNAKSSLSLGFARGAILTSVGYCNLDFVEFSPNKIKKTIVGNGKADKEQVMKMLKFVIPNVSFKTSDEADAIAIAYTAIVSRLFL